MKQMIALLFALSTFAFSQSYGNTENAKLSTGNSAVHEGAQEESLSSPFSLEEADGLLPDAIRITNANSSNSFNYTKKFISLSSALKYFKPSSAFNTTYLIRQQNTFSCCPFYISFRSLII
jgi:hypothetical protein